jgi:hypothetical protein
MNLPQQSAPTNATRSLTHGVMHCGWPLACPAVLAWQTNKAAILHKVIQFMEYLMQNTEQLHTENTRLRAMLKLPTAAAVEPEDPGDEFEPTVHLVHPNLAVAGQLELLLMEANNCNVNMDPSLFEGLALPFDSLEFLASFQSAMAVPIPPMPVPPVPPPCPEDEASCSPTNDDLQDLADAISDTDSGAAISEGPTSPESVRSVSPSSSSVGVSSSSSAHTASRLLMVTAVLGFCFVGFPAGVPPEQVGGSVRFRPAQPGLAASRARFGGGLSLFLA